MTWNRLGPAPLALALLLTGAPRVRAAAETGRPYLARPAATAPELVRQVQGSPRLTARYSKHFGVPAAAVLTALRRARPVVLPPSQYTVWLTKADGLRYPVRQLRARPTPAFHIPIRTLLDTEAWLERGTGNPISRFRIAEQVDVVVERPPDQVREVEVPREVLVPVAPPAPPP